MNTAGWLLTENGRQPWVVQGLLLTQNGNSPSVSLTEVAISLGTFWVLYIALGFVWGFLMMRYARRGLELADDVSDPPDGPGGSAPLAPALTY
jgi:cytochrome d ubiquinol oxidase subunit I